MTDKTTEAPDPCLVKREPSEPMFVLLARDSAAPRILEEWCIERRTQIERGLRPDTEQERAHIAEVWDKAATFRAWRRVNRK